MSPLAFRTFEGELMTQKIALLGCGRMGSAMAQGWLNAEDKPQISVYAPRPTPLVSEWAGKGEVVLNPVREPASADGR